MPIPMRLSTVQCMQIHALAYFTISVSLLAAQISYSDHCSSVVPEAVPDINSDPEDTFPLSPSRHSRQHDGYYSGNFSNILKTLNPSSPSFSGDPSYDSSNYLSFETRDVQKTNQEGILKVEADLTIRVLKYDGLFVMESSHRSSYFSRFFPGSSRRQKRTRGYFLLRLEGFWSESSKKLCMVGSTFSREGEADDDDLRLKAVLKMENVEDSVNITSLFTGTLESLSSSDDDDRHHFDAVSILMFPPRNYQYGLVTKEKESAGRNRPVGLSLESGSFCSNFEMLRYQAKLEYAANCDDPAKNCTLFGGTKSRHLDSLPRTMSWNVLDCSEASRKLRVLLHFSDMNWGYYRSFDPNMTLVGEGEWDDSKNLLLIVACRIHTDRGSFSLARVEDCSIDLSFLFPVTWSIKERNGMLGEIRSEKSTNESGYFSPVAIKDTATGVSGISGLKYKYTEAERVKRLCPVKKHEIENKREGKYPDRFSPDLSFSMSVRVSGVKDLAWGYSAPLFVGNRPYDRFAYGMAVSKTNSDSAIKAGSNSESRFNIAYQMSLMGLRNTTSSGRADSGTSTGSGSLDLSKRMEISAEGVYDTKTGVLCMVGCKSLENSKPDAMDCEVLINLQFPPLDSKKAKDTIKGSIESTRERLDPLYFDRLNISASTLYSEQSTWSIWRLDLELSLVLISNTFSCFFVGLQILYVRKHPQVLPMASLLMLTILALGPAVPLVLNFEDLFLENQNRRIIYFESRSWLEASEVLVRVATLVACLLQFRLLQLCLSSRWGEGGHGKPWAAEKKALLLSLPLYALGALAALLVNWKTNPENSMWGTLKCYSGLVLDGFLLPQVLLNIFRDSNEKALSVPFYVGMTLVRLVPHGYDLWRVRSFVLTQFSGSYIYGTPEGDFYSTAWDVIIPLGGIVFAAMIYLQQRFGGRCIIPQRFRKNSVLYKKLPVVSDP